MRLPFINRKKLRPKKRMNLYHRNWKANGKDQREIILKIIKTKIFIRAYLWYSYTRPLDDEEAFSLTEMSSLKTCLFSLPWPMGCPLLISLDVIVCSQMRIDVLQRSDVCRRTHNHTCRRTLKVRPFFYNSSMHFC